MLEQESQNPEILWRLARVCYNEAVLLENKNSVRKPLVLEGHKYATEAHRLAPKDFNVLKWAAVSTGALCEISAMREQTKLSFGFKSYLDQALIINPTDSALLHMRGRFSYSISTLSWFERKTATALFAPPPTANIDDALRDLLEALKSRPDWAENLLYIGLCYVSKKDVPNAQIFLKKAAEIQSTDPNELEAVQEAKNKLKSISK